MFYAGDKTPTEADLYWHGLYTSSPKGQTSCSKSFRNVEQDRGRIVVTTEDVVQTDEEVAVENQDTDDDGASAPAPMYQDDEDSQEADPDDAGEVSEEQDGDKPEKGMNVALQKLQQRQSASEETTKKGFESITESIQALQDSLKAKPEGKPKEANPPEPAPDFEGLLGELGRAEDEDFATLGNMRKVIKALSKAQKSSASDSRVAPLLEAVSALKKQVESQQETADKASRLIEEERALEAAADDYWAKSQEKYGTDYRPEWKKIAKEVYKEYPQDSPDARRGITHDRFKVFIASQKGTGKTKNQTVSDKTPTSPDGARTTMRGASTRNSTATRAANKIPMYVPDD